MIAPDQRGYGGSDAPERVEAYDLEHLTGDLVALLDGLGIERGHDWGGFVAWAMPVLHPARTEHAEHPVPDHRLPTPALRDDEKLYIQWFLATRGFRGPIN